MKIRRPSGSTGIERTALTVPPCCQANGFIGPRSKLPPLVMHAPGPVKLDRFSHGRKLHVMKKALASPWC